MRETEKLLFHKEIEVMYIVEQIVINSFIEKELTRDHYQAHEKFILQLLNNRRRMTMAYLLQVDFKMDGPFGDEMAEAFTDLAKSINEEEGFKSKVWTESPETNEAGGIYIFETKETAEKYLDMHTKRLAGFGVTAVNAKIFAINSKLTEITKGSIK